MDIKVGDIYESNRMRVEVVSFSKDESYVIYKYKDSNESSIDALPLSKFEKIYRLARKKRNTGEAYLEVVSGDLCIMVEDSYLMGFISRDGKCHIQSNKDMHEATRFWKEHGMKYDTTSVDWRGGVYQIDGIGYCLKKVSIHDGQIWMLNIERPYTNCADDNILRNDIGTPKIF